MCLSAPDTKHYNIAAGLHKTCAEKRINMIINRDAELEKIMFSKLSQIDDFISNKDVYALGLRLNALSSLYRALRSEEAADALTEALDKVLESSVLDSVNKNELKRFMSGTAMYTADDKKCLCKAYQYETFYMAYETKDGGKEQYNDVIGQYNAMNDELFATVKYSQDRTKALKKLSVYAASLIDTMEVMDQMIYEIFRKMQDYYKASVKAVLESGVTAEGMDDMDDEAELIFAYAVLKGCRMKALHTEKYEGIVLGVCDKVMSGEIFTGEDTEANDTIISMAALVYSETVRNREYQDYGRGKGGALWS